MEGEGRGGTELRGREGRREGEEFTGGKEEGIRQGRRYREKRGRKGRDGGRQLETQRKRNTPPDSARIHLRVTKFHFQ